MEELERADQESCAAWERDYAVEIAMSPFLPPSSSEDFPIGDETGPYGYVPPDACYTNPGDDSDEFWF